MSRDLSSGKVYIIGAGPGDRDLITVKGLKKLKEAEVIIYDYLANLELLEECAPGSERLYVGKMGGNHAKSQDEINTLLVTKAREGKIVARLKGGDPFVFGRGGEEALELASRGIRFEIIPGITAAVAAAAYAGIPLTHRGLASTAALVTGHEDPGKAESDMDWQALGAGSGTLAFYMGVKNLSAIAGQLMKHGRKADTPVALIRWGTLNCQETLTGTLEDISERAREARFAPPAILLVGDVVTLRERLRWFDTRPLFGRRIVVTRSRAQASDLSSSLRDLGAQVSELPTIDIEPVEDFTALDRAFRGLSSFSWIVFTSVNSVQIFFSRLLAAGLDSRALGGVRIAAVGPVTASIERFGLVPDLVPERFTSEETLKVFRALKDDYRGEKILFPGSEIARDLLPAGLEAMGAEVVRIPVYRNLVPEYSGDTLDKILAEADLVTFTSSSTVTNLASILREHGREEYLKRIRGASIGPVTSGTAKQLGIAVTLEAGTQTIRGLVEAIENYLTQEEGT